MAQYSSPRSSEDLNFNVVTQVGAHVEEGNAGEIRDGVHHATIEEKKRRWWRNALINLVVMAAWCAYTLALHMNSFDI